MIKVLQVIYGLNIGGAETFVMNVLSNLNVEEFHMDFVIQDKNIRNEKLHNLCKEKGCSIYVVTQFHRNLLKYVKELKKIMQMPYDVVHVHANALINITPILMAKRYNKKIVIHSHSTKNHTGGNIGQAVHSINRKILKKIAATNVACGDQAGRWMYGDKPYMVLDNAVSINTYCFDEEKRSRICGQYGLKGKIVIGHVGRFVEAKNHRFLISVFSKFFEIHKNAVLMLVGDGPLLQDVKKQARELLIDNSVIFCGSQADISAYYSAFDCLLFPSSFEGLPFVLVEAQASGLPVVASDRVTKEMDVTGNIEFLSLDEKEEKWLEAIENAVQPVERPFYTHKMKESKYNIEVMVKKVEDLYRNIIKL